MNKRLFIASALAAAISTPLLLSAQKPAPAPTFKAEKCYGIAKAGKNDCASTGNNSCGGTSKLDRDPRPGSTCRKVTANASSAAARLPSRGVQRPSPCHRFIAYRTALALAFAFRISQRWWPPVPLSIGSKSIPKTFWRTHTPQSFWRSCRNITGFRSTPLASLSEPPTDSIANI